MRLRPVVVVVASLFLAGALSACSIPGGVAYAIKSMNKKDGQNNAQPTQSAQSQAPAPVEAAPPPPEAAPRESITVEQLN